MKIPSISAILISLALLSGCSESTQSADSKSQETATSMGRQTLIEAEKVETPIIVQSTTPAVVENVVEAPEESSDTVRLKTLKANPGDMPIPESGTPEHKRYRKFNQADVNKDGLLDREEFKHSLQQWMDHRGYSAAKQARVVKTVFDKRDSNKDGMLTLSEYIHG